MTIWVIRMANINLKTSQQNFRVPLKPDTPLTESQTGFISKQQDDYQPDDWELTIGQALVESSKRMEHDQVYRKEIQRRTR